MRREERISKHIAQANGTKKTDTKKYNHVGEGKTLFLKSLSLAVRNTLQVIKQNNRAQCCIYLDFYRIFSRANERFYLQVLFDLFKKQFDLPTLPVNSRNSCWLKSTIVSSDRIFLCLGGGGL